MTRLSEVFPDPETLLRLDTEEIGVLVLEYLKSLGDEVRGVLHRYNFCLGLQDYAGSRYREVSEAVSEAWTWLEQERFLVSRPSSAEGTWMFITKRGWAFKGRADLETYRQGKILDSKLLHPVLAERVAPLFLRGDYDTAVFQALKEVEVSVRNASGLEARRVGTDLMRTAFNVQSGPLTDTSLVEAERQAMSDLFAGAIGLLKNPPGHRAVVLTPIDAARQIQIADYLLRIVDSRAKQRGP